MTAAVHGPRVTQADRDAASKCVRYLTGNTFASVDIVQGRSDRSAIVEAFARHREASQAELLEALAAFQAHVIHHSCTWDDAQNGSHHHPIWQQVAAALTKARTNATGEGA